MTRVSLLVGVAICALHVPAMAQSGGQTPAAAPLQVDTLPSGSAADVVVIGTRASDRTAQDTKRNSDQIVDSVVAEDIGALPDFNVAEALQRVPGILVARNEFTGEGNGVSVRGLNQITTSLGGRNIFSGVGRSLNLGEVPAGIVGRVDVYKSPQADQIEAGLGGTVDVKLRNPTELKKLTMSVTARGVYRQLGKSLNPSFTGLIGNNWNVGDDGKLGVLISGLYDKRRFRTDRMALEIFTDRRNLIDRDGDRVFGNDPDDSIYVPQTLTTRYSEGSFERKAIAGRVQYRKGRSFEVYLDGLYNSYVGEEQHSYIAARLNSLLYGVRATLPSLSSFTTRADGRTLETATFTNTPFQASTYTQDDKNSVWQIGGGFKANTGRLFVTGDLSLIRSKVDGTFREFVIGGIAPKFYMDLRPKTPFYDYQDVDLTNPANYRVNNLTLRNYPNVGKEWAERIDARYDLRWPVLDQILWGVRYTQRSADRIGRDGSVSILNRTSTGEPLAAGLGPTPDNLFDNRFDLTDTRWLRPLPDVVRNFPQLLTDYGQNPAFPLWNPLLNYSFRENSRAAYVMANLAQPIGSMKLTGNVGLRYVRTGQESDGFFTAPQGGEPRPLQINRNYQRLLPSANLSLRITPDLVVRTAYSEVFSRPNFVDLSPARNLNYVTVEGSGGNPVLQPYTAKQYDATVEYYFGRPGFAYLGLFRKDLDGYYQRVILPEVIEGQTFLISQLINTDKAKITGWEAGYQQQFDFLPGILSGLGARYAFTHVNSNRFNSQLNRDEPLAGLSKNAYNLMLTYEKKKIRWNIAYNWRQQYPIILDPGGALNLPQVRASFGIWDGSITYQVRPNLAVFFDMSNITGVRGEEYFTSRDRPRAFFLSDQTIGFGIRSNF